MKRLAVLALILLPLTANADILYLKGGGQLEGRIVEEGFSYVRIETAKGFTEIDRDDIDRIVRKPWTPPPGRAKKKKPKGKDPFPPLPPKPRIRLSVIDREPVHNFRISFPAGWEKGTAEDGVLISFYGPRAGGFEPRIDLEIERDGGKLKDFAKKIGKGLGTLKDTVTMKLGKNDAIRMVGEDNGSKSIGLVVDDGERKVVLTFKAPADKFKALADGVSMAFRSLRVFPEHKLTREQRSDFTTAYNTAQTALHAKDIKGALAALDQCRKLVPNYPNLYHLYAKAYSYQKNWSKGIKVFKTALKLDPDNYDYNYYCSSYESAKSKHKDAVKHATVCTEVDPWNEAAWVNLGNCLTRKRDYKRGKVAYQRAIEINPKSIPATFNLGVMFEVQGKDADAKIAYETVLKIDPDHAQAKAALARVK